jgi:hypothetical protein
MLIEIGVVNAHSPFIVLFLYKDGISYPLWMDYFLMKPAVRSLAISHLIASRLS